MCMCESPCGIVHVCAGVHGGQGRGRWILPAGVAGSCELPEVGDGN